MIDNFVTPMEEADVVDKIPFSQTGDVALDTFLKKIIVFGYFKFHGKQDAVNAILANNDCIVLMATGGGKTEYYEVLGIILPRFTIVVTPVIGYTWSLSWQTCGSIKFSSKVF